MADALWRAGTHIGKVLVDTRQAAEQPVSRHCMGPRQGAPSVTSHVQDSQLPPLPVQPHMNFRYAPCRHCSSQQHGHSIVTGY